MAFNKTLCMILKTIVDKNMKAWPDKRSGALWAYIRIPAQATPYLLDFWEVAVLPLEIELLSIKVILYKEIRDDEWRKANWRFTELEAIDEERLIA